MLNCGGKTLIGSSPILSANMDYSYSGGDTKQHERSVRFWHSPIIYDSRVPVKGHLQTRDNALKSANWGDSANKKIGQKSDSYRVL